MTTSTPAPASRPARSSALRREPMQARSARRVSAMLDACGQILDESGYDGLNTTLVAERAQVAIGSVYQFFPDKRALALALGQRNVDLFVGRIHQLFDDHGFTTWQEAVTAVVDAYVEMHRTVPGFSVVEFGDQFGQRLPAAGQAANSSRVAEQLSTLLIDRFGLQPSPELPFALANVVAFSEAMFQLAFRRNRSGDPATIDDAKWLVQTYLARYLRPS